LTDGIHIKVFQIALARISAWHNEKSKLPIQIICIRRLIKREKAKQASMGFIVQSVSKRPGEPPSQVTKATRKDALVGRFNQIERI